MVGSLTLAKTSEIVPVYGISGAHFGLIRHHCPKRWDRDGVLGGRLQWIVLPFDIKLREGEVCEAVQEFARFLENLGRFRIRV